MTLPKKTFPSLVAAPANQFSAAGSDAAVLKLNELADFVDADLKAGVLAGMFNRLFLSKSQVCRSLPLFSAC